MTYSVNRLLTFLQAHSPHLSQLAERHPDVIERALDAAQASAAFNQTLQDIPQAATPAELFGALRRAKAKISLLVAAADIAGVWPLESVTGALSQFADAAISSALNTLLRDAHQRGEIELKDVNVPAQNCGIIVLGMGKLGAFELNYSSDIDLIFFYEPGKLGYKGRQTEQQCLNRIVQETVRLLQERTAEGYVFRTDIRLRPDPASTPPAITTNAAMYYYESVGQNWERAAMIKARPVAGDIPAGEAFMKQLRPYMWRRSLDFNAINDIHSIKRQMDSRGRKDISIPGHNIKLGPGGIREIEFFTQVNQLIWGGREPSLRLRGTCESLKQLTAIGIVPPEQSNALIEAYGFLRKLEHRLQMVADQQTHELPETDDGLKDMSAFMGFESTAAFFKTLDSYLQTVHRIFSTSFKSADELGGEGSLVFTGVSHDPETLETLTKMGFKQPEKVSEAVMGWHHGSRRCTRTKRARELLTELMPTILKALGQTAQPDYAFEKFDAFMDDLPAGVQLFTLFTMNPALLDLIAEIMGSAPVLAENLSKFPALLDGVLQANFYKALPDRAELERQLDEMLAYSTETEERLEMLRRFKHEKQFQAGVQLLKKLTPSEAGSAYLSCVAELVLARALQTIQVEFEKTYGKIPGSRFAIIALGKLGSQEMQFGSDLDLVFVYDVPDFEANSDGEKAYPASVYYNRFCPRLLTALTSMGREGKLYEVDTRLRPSGKQGLLAVSTQAFKHYFEELAWTFEFMSLTRGRAVAGDPALIKELNTLISLQLQQLRTPETLQSDVREMRERVAGEFTPTPWNLKYAEGGVMELDFLSQYWLLAHAPRIGAEYGLSTKDILQHLQQHNAVSSTTLPPLLEANTFLSALSQYLRLCTGDALSEETTSVGLQQLLCRTMGFASFDALEAKLLEVEKQVHAAYISAITT